MFLERTAELFFLRITVDFLGKKILREARLLSPPPSTVVIYTARIVCQQWSSPLDSVLHGQDCPCPQYSPLYSQYQSNAWVMVGAQ